jgi:hypothetical protein
MQWSTPRPGIPWPQDMVITVDDHQEIPPLIPPFWTTEYDWDGLDREAFTSWHRDLSPPIPHDVERKSLSDLIPA